MPSSPGAPSPIVVISDSESGDDASASDALSRPAAEHIASSLRTQAEVKALCRKHRVPKDFAPRPAGELRACSAPPRGAVCVYAHALDAGLRFPLPAFVCDVLTHFRLAPGQLSPNGWQVLVAFVALCYEAGVRPSMTLLQHFFKLHNRHGWYWFRSRESAGELFTGLRYSRTEKDWKEGFFFLTSPEPWRCPVRWGEPPSKSSVADPVLTSQQEEAANKLLGVHGAGGDIRTYLREANLAAAFSSNLAGAPPPPPPPQPSPRSAVAKGKRSNPDSLCPISAHSCQMYITVLVCALGTNPPVRDMADSMPVEKTPPPAAGTGKVKSEAHGDTLPFSGTKRKREEAAAKDGRCSSAAVSDPNPCAPPGFHPQSPRSPVPDTHDGDSVDWGASKKALERIVTPSQERRFAAMNPSEVLASGYVAMHRVHFQPNRSSVGVCVCYPNQIVCGGNNGVQATNFVSFSLDYALELEKKLVEQEGNNVVLWEKLEKEKAARQAAEAELEQAKRATGEELKSAKETAVKEFKGSEDCTRLVAKEALAAYLHGAEEMKRVVLQHYPYLDAAKLEPPLK